MHIAHSRWVVLYTHLYVVLMVKFFVFLHVVIGAYGLKIEWKLG